MKSLICSIALVLSAFVLQAQWPIQQNLGSASTLVQVPPNGGFRANLINRSYADTTSANLGYSDFYPGSQIFTTDCQCLWFRNAAADGWVQLLPSGGSSGNHAWLVGGNSTFFGGSTTPEIFGTTLGVAKGVNLTTNGVTRVALASTGLGLLSAASDTTLNKPMTYNTSTKSWNYGYWYGSGGGGSSGWALLGNSGTTAGTNFVGTTDGQDLVFKRNSVESGRFSASGNLNLGLTGTTLGSLGLSGNTSGLITIKGQAAAGTYNFNLPTTAGTSGYVLASAAGGSNPMTWVNHTTLQHPISSLTDALNANSIDNLNYDQQWGWSNLEGSGLMLSTTTTNGTGGHLLDINMTGDNATQDATGISIVGGKAINTQYGISSTLTGASTLNLAGSFVASGGTSNIGILVAGIGGKAAQFTRGSVEFGTSGVESGVLKIFGSTSGTVTIQPQAAAGTYNFNLPTTAGTSGQFLTSAGGVGSPMTWTTSTSGLTVGTTTIASGTNTRVLYNNAGVLGEYTVTGTGTTSVLSTTPTIATPVFTTSAQVPLLIGGTAANDDITINGTSNGTKATSYVLLQPTGGFVGVGTSAPASPIEFVHGTATNDVTIMGLTAGTSNTTYISRGRWASNFNGSYFSQNASYNGSAWVADDVNRPVAMMILNCFNSADGQILFKTSASNNAADGTTQLSIAGNGGLTATSLAGTGTRMVEASSAGLLSATQIVTSGTYTPTLTNSANIAASTAYSCQYMRVGNTVTVSGQVDIDPTLTATTTTLGITLPIASAIANANELGGTAFCPAIAAMGAAMLGDATNDRCTLQFISSDVSNNILYFSFTYRIL